MKKMRANNFSPTLLRYLRNNIPIRNLIKNVLKVPCEIKQGIFRFNCPMCNGSDTRINASKNLAHCFSCKKKFNPIDIVIAVKRIKFIPAVTFLIKHSDNSLLLESVQKNSEIKQEIKYKNSNLSENKPVPIKEVIPSIIKRAKSKKKFNEDCCDGCLNLARRFEIAEKKLKELRLQVTKLQMIINQNYAI